ncbi:hypothetical protein U1Q18_046489, partial [Sarracenia purpurea var. burkii]
PAAPITLAAKAQGTTAPIPDVSAPIPVVAPQAFSAAPAASAPLSTPPTAQATAAKAPAAFAPAPDATHFLQGPVVLTPASASPVVEVQAPVATAPTLPFLVAPAHSSSSTAKKRLPPNKKDPHKQMRGHFHPEWMR